MPAGSFGIAELRIDMRIELILWIGGGVIGSVCLLSMMRRRQVYLFDLLKDFIKQQRERAKMLSRAQRLIERSEKIRASKGGNSEAK